MLGDNKCHGEKISEGRGPRVLGVVDAVLSKVVRKSLTEPVTFGRISEEGKKVSHMAIWEKECKERAQ